MAADTLLLLWLLRRAVIRSLHRAVDLLPQVCDSLLHPRICTLCAQRTRAQLVLNIGVGNFIADPSRFFRINRREQDICKKARADPRDIQRAFEFFHRGAQPRLFCRRSLELNQPDHGEKAHDPAGHNEFGVLVKRELLYNRYGNLVGLDRLDLTFNDRRIDDRELSARRVGPLCIDQDLRGCGVGRLRHDQIEAAGAQSEAHGKQERGQSSPQHLEHVCKRDPVARRGTGLEICGSGGI